MRSDTRLSALFDTLEAGPGFEQRGKVRGAIGTAIRVSGVTVRIGDICELASPAGRHSLLAEVVGLSEHEAILSPMGDLRGLSGETEVMVRGRWNRACAPATGCGRGGAGSGAACSPRRAAARAPCWARSRGRRRPTSSSSP